MKNRTIGVLMGGMSSEREVSLRSGEAVLAALTQRGYRALPIYVDRDVDRVLRQISIDVAFIALHGRYGEDGCVQGLLEVMGIPYTGSDVLASALAMHKVKSKELFRLHNLPTAPYYVASDDGELAVTTHGDFGYPCVVKPAREGSSFGVTKVEGYPGLIVHGPLIATLLVDLLRRNLPGATIAAFAFRALKPVFDIAPFFVCGRPEAPLQPFHRQR